MYAVWPYSITSADATPALEVHHDALVQSRPLCGAMAMTLREVS